MLARRPGIVVAVALAAVLAAVSIWRLAPNGLAGGTQPFNPLRGNFATPWNTDRELVDIEIVGSTSLIPDRHRLEPERVLRFRLEKAYVSALLAEKEPGYEIIAFSLDRDTRLPESFFQAVSIKGPGHEDIPVIPNLPLLTQVQRVLQIKFQSDRSIEPLMRMSRIAGHCRGREVEPQLFDYDLRGGKECPLLLYPAGTRRYIASFERDLSLIVACQYEDAFPTIDCEVQFPYGGFGATLRFNHDQLATWRAGLSTAIEFLRSKEYR
jgi:hypothetical protein